MLLDFEDLLVRSHELLSSDETIRGKYLEMFQSVLVDEFQDTTPLQFSLMKLLISENQENSSLFIVGDDAQSIYAFAGASLGNLLNFHKNFPTSEQFILDLNFRSTKKVVQACSNLASHFKHQISKNFRTNNAEGDEVVVLESSNEVTEAMALVREITDLVERKEYAYKEIAVLYRANFQSLYPEEAFLQNKIPFLIQGGQHFYNRREVKILLDYLRVINDPNSEEADGALMNILNAPVRYVTNALKAELQSFSSNTGVHLYQGLKSMDLDWAFVKRNLYDFIALMDPLIESAATLEPAEIVKLLRSKLDYDRFIIDEDIPTADDVVIENLNQLQLSAARYDNIASFLEYTDSFGDSKVSEDKDGVHLMTIHKSKGLEFRAVFVIGMVENLLPSAKGNIEEERRICFVAISRAKDLLFLSYPLSYLNQPSKKSIFIDEILGTEDPG